MESRPKIAETIASPSENPELFTEGWEEALEREKGLAMQKDDASEPESKPPGMNGHADEDG